MSGCTSRYDASARIVSIPVSVVTGPAFFATKRTRAPGSLLRIS
jgi:hypothetical protein